MLSGKSVNEPLMPSDVISLAEFEKLLVQIVEDRPNGEQYQFMSSLVLDIPEARELARMDPFNPGYKAVAMELYLYLRGRAELGYVAARDELSAVLPENLWTGLIPWSFRDAKMVSEHVLAWGHILEHLNLPPGGAVLEYGPGSGQFLIMAARLGYRACGVDIDTLALNGIRAQSAHLNLTVETERAEFGEGFGDERFDTILFYESFHHAFHFDTLLAQLHSRLKRGGRIILCGEPVVSDVTDGIPYPWGPRLDALSVFCMRRFGWMELGFTHDYLVEVVRLAGWAVTHHPYPRSGRATIYVLRPVNDAAEDVPSATPDAQLHEQIRRLKSELTEIRASTSWRVTSPMRASKNWCRRLRGHGSRRTE
jgi:SAM-dependent methyltransferase